MAKEQKMQHSKKINAKDGRDYLMKILTLQQNNDYLMGWAMRLGEELAEPADVYEKMRTIVDADDKYRYCVLLAKRVLGQKKEMEKLDEDAKAEATKAKKAKLKEEDAKLREQAEKRIQEKSTHE